MSLDDKSRIERLKKEIYKRDFETTIPSPTQHFTEREEMVEKGWQHTDTPEAPRGPKNVTSSFFRKIFIFSVLFFVLSAGALAYMYFSGWNIVGSNKVDITFLGPVSIAAGTELNFDINITNQNRVDIAEATLFIDYPDGTKQVVDITKDLEHEKELVGVIAPGETARRTSRSVMFGELNTRKEIKVTLEYGLKNLNAQFRKTKNYEVVISSTPITVIINHPEEVVSNDIVEFDVSVISNSSVPLTDVLVKADYPFGYAFLNSDPVPSYDSSVWYLASLEPGETKNFKIRGQVQGEQGDERVFRFSIGSRSSTTPKVIATRYLLQSESVFVKRPPIGITFKLDDTTGPQFTTQQGSLIRGSIEIVNNQQSSILNTQIDVTFGGQLFNPGSVTSGGAGFYRSIDNTISWVKKGLERLESLEPGERVNVGFNFSTLPVSSIALQNGTMTLVAKVTGSQITEGNVVQPISTTLSKTVLTQTSVGLLTRAVHSVGPFTNTGPIPPKVNQKTTYTIIWTTTNSLNDVRGAQVSAILPSYVRWLGQTSPQSEVVTWNPDKNEVVWRVGDLVAGAGSVKPAREVAFQVELLPSISQLDSLVTLMFPSSMTAIDSFTNTSLKVDTKEINTLLVTDPKYHGEEARVVQ